MFGYDNDKDLKVCFLVTRVISGNKRDVIDEYVAAERESQQETGSGNIKQFDEDYCIMNIIDNFTGRLYEMCAANGVEMLVFF